MTRRLSSLTLDVLDDIPDPCRSCVFWELDPVSGARALAEGDPAFDKEAWVSATLLSWGSCGTIAYVDDLPAGWALYAPPAAIPRAAAFPTAPVASDAVLLTALQVLPGHTGGGLGRMLVQGMVRDLARRGVRAVEAFGDARPEERAAGDPSCVVPAGFLLAVGFKTVRPHRRWPRLRLDVKGAQSWRAEAEAIVEKVLGARRPVRSPEPAFRR
jgi:GNAT superfamily N-acetyltransferase